MKPVTHRFDDVRRILTLLHISGRQTIVLLLLGTVCAGFEAVGVSLLLPVLRYVEQATVGTLGRMSIVETMVARIAGISGVPTLLVLVLIAFLPVHGRQAFRYITRSMRSTYA